LTELVRLAAQAQERVVDTAEPAAVSPADQLAAWLLRQTDLTAVE
jgi:hypothetical protein